MDTTQFRILVLEDDYLIQRLIVKALEEDGYQVSAADSAADAMQIIERFGLPHLAIVDIMLSYGMDGLEFCRAVHQFSDLPVIVLSAITNSDTIIHAIEECAEDYITKPFVPGELLARVRRVLRRLGDFAYVLDSHIDVDNRLRVCFQRKQVIIDEQPVTLTPTETKLLYILMRNAGRTVTTPFISQRMWPMESEQTDRLRVCIHRLRRKLGTNENNIPYIQSRRGKGYSFVTDRLSENFKTLSKNS